MKKKWASIVSLVLVVLMVLSGCAADPASPAPQATTTQSSTSAVGNTSEDTVELTYWTGTWHETLLPDLLVKFNEKYPNIKINAEYFPWDGMADKYTVALQSNSGPDLMNLAYIWILPYSTMGKLENLNSYIDKAGVDLSDFFTGALQAGQKDGNTFALPYRTEGIALIYNKDMFKAANLDPEKPPETWAQLREYAKKLTTDKVAGFGMCGKQVDNVTIQIYSLMMSNGAELIKSDGLTTDFTSPKAIEAFTNWVEMATVDKSVPASVLENDNTTNRNLFANEQVAMYISASYDLQPIKEANPDINMGFGLFPAMTTKEDTKTQIGGWSLGMTNTCKNKDAAFDFINFFTSTEMCPLYSDTLPARKSSMSNDLYKDPDYKIFFDCLDYAKAIPASSVITQVNQAVYVQAQAVLAGEATINDAMAAAAKDAEAALKDAKF